MADSPYAYQFDPAGDSTAARVVRNVGSGKRVLELGCAYGAMTKVLLEHAQCSVFGIEIDEASAAYAKDLCEGFAVLDIENADWDSVLGDRHFDVIVAADVLEHLRNPQRCLMSLRKFLVPDGYIVLSIPNVAYNGVLAELLNEDFKYRRTGLLDATHLRFWGAQGIARLLEDCGYVISSVETTRVEPEQSEFVRAWYSLPNWLAYTLRLRPDGDVYQYVIKAFSTGRAKNCPTVNWPSAPSLPSLSDIDSSISTGGKYLSALSLAPGSDASDLSVWGRKLRARLDETDRSVFIEMSTKVAELSTWGSELQTRLEETDKLVLESGAQVAELSRWGRELQTQVEETNKRMTERECELAAKHAELECELAAKHAELMKMSDWAQGLSIDLERIRAELDRINSRWWVRAIRFPKRALRSIKSRLAASPIGGVVRYARELRRHRLSHANLEAFKKSLSANDGSLIITFPIITWDFRWQRPQHIVTRLRNKGFAVLYLAMSIMPKERRYRSSKEAFRDLSFDLLDSHIHQVWLHSDRPINIYTDKIEGDDLANLSAGLSAIMKETGAREIYYLIQFPGWSGVAFDLQRQFGGKVIFDCMDDHGGFSTNSSEALKNEEALIEDADLVITSSLLLENKTRARNPNTILVKNGTEFEHFHRPVHNGELEHLTDKPIIGYYGAISDWFDLDLVQYCAQQRPEWNFVLIGATAGCDTTSVKHLGNVHLLGEKPYKSLPGYLAYFDVCTIPFKIIPLTLATNPVKFYEYLSSGKPVVSVELPELLPYQDDCYLAGNRNDFLAQLQIALNEKNDPILIDRRIALARNNSWDSRVEAIISHAVFESRKI